MNTRVGKAAGGFHGGWRLACIGLVLAAALVGGQLVGDSDPVDAMVLQEEPAPSEPAAAVETVEGAEPAPDAPAAVAPAAEAPEADAPAMSEEVETCMSCHGDPGYSTTRPDGSVRSLYIDIDRYFHSTHGAMDCTMCHGDATEIPHPENLAEVNCGMCHGEAEEYAESLHAVSLARGDHDAASCDDCHGTHDILPSSNPLSRTHARNLTQTCGVCHSDRDMMRRHMVSVMEPSDAYMRSTHYSLVQEGRNGASCNDCHGTHDLKPSNDPESKVYRANIPATCGQCHPQALEEYNNSIHGRAMYAGVKDSPTCVDCHGEHDIEGAAGVSSAVHRQQVSRQTCPRCHDDERVMERYGIAVMRQASYMDSYHGMASAAGSRVVASCTSCHGVHNILPHRDPESSVHKDNLPATCGQCHPNANPNFAAGPVHIIPTDPGQRALGLVRLVYLWIIGLTIGGMVAHNTLMMGRHAMTKFHRERRRGPGVFRRFTRGQVWGHVVLTVAFIVLTISGFALRYPDSWMTRWFFFGDTGLAVRSTIHRLAGLVLVGLTVANILYSIFFRHGRAELRSLTFGFKDIRDIFHNLLYFVGLAKRQPKFDRYSYSEKFEYWGLWWGSVIMIVTGFCMWYADLFLSMFPKVALDIAALIHFYEAWLAMLTIVIWHMYYMVFAPDTYPMNWSWITGNITEEDLKERHPLEYERLTGDAVDETGRADHPAAPEDGGEAVPPMGAGH